MTQNHPKKDELMAAIVAAKTQTTEFLLSLPLAELMARISAKSAVQTIAETDDVWEMVKRLEATLLMMMGIGMVLADNRQLALEVAAEEKALREAGDAKI